MASSEMEAAQARVVELKRQLVEAEAAVVAVKVAEDAQVCSATSRVAG
jgi:hypothetical protein